MNKKCNKFIVVLIIIISNFGLFCQEKFIPSILKDDINISINPKFGLTTYDGGYLLVCNGVNKKYESYCHISKYDVNGKQLWYKRFNDFVSVSIIELNDGSIVLNCCIPEVSFDQLKTIFIVKLNTCGEIEWAKIDKTEYHKGWNLFASRTMIDTGDGIVFPMRFDLNDPETDEVILRTDILKIDYSGKVIFRNWIQEHGDFQEIWNGVVDSEGNILMNGNCIAKDPNGHGYGKSPLIIKCDSEGNLLFIKSAADTVIDVFGNDYSNRSIIDDENNFLVCVPDSFVPLGSGKYDYKNTIIKTDNDGNITTHKFTNPDIQLPDDRHILYGFSFINNKQNLVTVMNYIHDDNMSINKKQQSKLDLSKYENSNFNRVNIENIPSTLNQDGDNDEYWKMVRNRLYVLDKEAKVIDSTDLEKYFDLGEYVKYIFTSDNNEIMLVTINRRFDMYTGRLHKFNSDLEPALIDNTPREYDIYCDGQITSGLVKPEWEPLYPPDMIQEFNKEQPVLRLSPNPAQNSVKLYLNFGYGEKQIEFYDTTGRLCKTIIVTDGWAQETIDISDLKQGIYIVKLKAENNITATEKLIVR